MSSVYPWLPKSGVPRRLARWTVNRLFPGLRNRLPLPNIDGPLPAMLATTPAAPPANANDADHDPFAYMQDLDHPATLQAVSKEQLHYRLFSGKLSLKSIKGHIWGEIDARAVTTTREGGFDKGEERIGDHIYFTRVVDENDSGAMGFYRKQVGQSDKLAEELINPVVLQQQFGYQSCSIGTCRVSQDGQYLAYTLSVEGGDRYICHLRSANNASLFHVIQGRNIAGIEFGSGNYFFYTESNALNRPCCVMMQEIRPGLLPPPVEIYRDDDEEFFVDVRKTKDNAYLTITSDSKTRGNVLVAPASYPVIPRALHPLFRDKAWVEVAGKEGWNWLEHYHDHFLLVTSDHGDNFRVVYARDEVVLKRLNGSSSNTNEAPGATPRSVWQELVPHRASVQIVDIDLFEGWIVLYETHDEFERLGRIRVIDVRDGLHAAAQRSREGDVVLHFPPLTVVTPGLNRNFHQDAMSFVYSGIIQPARECVFAFQSDLTAAQARLCAPESLYTQRQSEQFTPWDYMWPYHAYRDVCTSADGTDIALSIFHRRDMFVEENTDFERPASAPKPCLICVYGSYGEVPGMHFQLAPYMWLLRRKWTIAFAHIRGGGEWPGWAERGRRRHKPAAVDDFIACCEHLVRAGYTKPDLLVALGSSAGCVPIAAAMNRRGSDLFGHAILRAPFLDILHTMSDPTLPLTLAEREEWGDPVHSAADRAVLRQYDPYHNLNDRVRYPGLFISACLDDERVPAWNALKYVAALRHQRHRTGVDPIATPLVLRLRATGGHQYWNETEHICEELAFLAVQFDLEGGLRAVRDMDALTHMYNLTLTGVVDQDDQRQVFLKWDNWERERLDYHVKLNNSVHEPNFRQMKAEKEPYFWIPNEAELDQRKVDEMFRAKSRDARESGRGEATTGSTGKPTGRNFYANDPGTPK